MESLQDNLSYYQRQKQQILSNPSSYQAIRYYQVHGPWQQASYTFRGFDILSEHGTKWWRTVFWKRGRIGHVMKNDEHTKHLVKQAIAVRLGRPVDEIGQIHIDGSGRGEDPTYHFAGENVLFNTYTVGYQHRISFAREERYFDQEKYAQALRACEQNMQATQAAIDSQILQLEIGNNHKQELLQEQQQQICQVIKEANHEMRALLLSKTWAVKESADIIDTIKSLGFDANKLAYYAIINNNSDLFDVACAYGANCSTHLIKEQTLLQLIIQENREVMLAKYLAQGDDLTTTMINAVVHNDLLTITKLSSYNPELLKQKFDGFTLLQIAIAAENFYKEVIEKILSLNPKSAEILTNSGESALEIALRVGNNEIIELVASYAQLETELAQSATTITQSIDQSATDQLSGSNIQQVTRDLQQDNTTAGQLAHSTQVADQQSLQDYQQALRDNVSDAAINSLEQEIQKLSFNDHDDNN